MVMLDDQQVTDLECFKNKTHKMTVPIGITNKILIFLLVCYLEARPKDKWSSRRAAKPYYCHKTLPATASQPF